MLSKRAKYAINALVYLARQPAGAPVLISQIAQAERIPQKFLEAILLTLKRAAILDSKKGRGGGYLLLKQPSEVNMADIMRLFDGPVALLPCVTHQYYQRCEECRSEADCGIRKTFLIIRNQTVALLKEATLQQIISREAGAENILRHNSTS